MAIAKKKAYAFPRPIRLMAAEYVLRAIGGYGLSEADVVVALRSLAETDSLLMHSRHKSARIAVALQVIRARR